VKRERLDFLAENPRYTKRLAYYIGRRCRSETIRDLAAELGLDWHTVKELEKQYMREQLRRAGTPGPKVIGIDELSIRKRHTYRIVVSDLVRLRPIWFGGLDRSEAVDDHLKPKKSDLSAGESRGIGGPALIHFGSLRRSEKGPKGRRPLAASARCAAAARGLHAGSGREPRSAQAVAPREIA